MLSIYICEDNDNQRTYLTKLVKNIILMEDFDIQLELSSADPHEIISHVEKNSNPGLYFLDIDLNTDINGLVLAQEIRKKDTRGFIVFITTHSEMSFMTFSYKVEALDFIIKDDVHLMDERVHKCIIDAYEKFSSPNNVTQRIYRISSDDRDTCIPLEDIIYFETSENIHKVILHTENKIIEFHAKLKDVELELDDRFCRCHRSFIVNKDKISEIDLKNRVLTLSNNDDIFASKQGIKKVLE